MDLRASGFTSLEIADKLSLAQSTVDTHTHRVVQKMGVRHAHAAVIEYVRALYEDQEMGGPGSGRKRSQQLDHILDEITAMKPHDTLHIKFDSFNPHSLQARMSKLGLSGREKDFRMVVGYDRVYIIRLR